jgi:tetrahydromethanopterin S-methyltransferase subunit G
MKGILKEYHEPSGPIDTISTALSNVRTRKDLFMRAFRSNSELPMLMYDNIVLAIVNGISYMIAACIEFIKAPKDESFQISLDKVAYAKTKDHLLYQSLDKFNKSCANGDFDKAMEAVIDQRTRKLTGATIGIIAGTVAGVILILNIIPILRELVYVFYYSRMRISDFFEVQADLLTMNAYNLEHNNTIDADKKKEIVEKQTAIADKFRKISNATNIDSKKTDVEASKELQNTKKKYKLDELEDEAESSSDEGSSSALF